MGNPATPKMISLYASINLRNKKKYRYKNSLIGNNYEPEKKLFIYSIQTYDL